MRDPMRLIDSADEFERDLLRSADADHPARARRARSLAALGMTAAAASTTTTVAGAGVGAPAAVTVSNVLLVKWVGVAVVALVASAGTVHALRKSREESSKVALVQQTRASGTATPHDGAWQPVAPPAASDPPEPPVQPVEPQPPEHVRVAPPQPLRLGDVRDPPALAPLAQPPAESLEAPPNPSHGPAASTHPSAAPASDTLAAEVAALDDARTALRNRQPARTLALLDDYARRYPRGTLAQEAALLRIEALLAQGNRAEARRFGRSFLEASPGSPLAARVRALLDSVIDPSPSNN